MRVLLAVIDAGSLSAGGRRLGMPLATVSRKVSELEAVLKTQLLVRTTRSLALTDSGRAYVESCRRILDDVAEAERVAAGEYSEPRGELVVTAPVLFGRLQALPVIGEFLQAFPHVSVRLALGDRVLDLMEDHVDLAIRIGALPDSSLVSTRLGSVRRILCASPDYLKKSGVPRQIDTIAEHACISFESLTGGNVWKFRVNDAEVTVPIRPRLVVSTAEAAVDAAIAGLGITSVLSYQAQSAFQRGELVLLLEEFEPEPIPVSFVYPNPGRLPLKLRALLDFAAPRLRDRLQGVASVTTRASRGGAA